MLVWAADAGPVARAAGQSLTAAPATGNGPCAGPLSSEDKDGALRLQAGRHRALSPQVPLPTAARGGGSAG
jgi:hypothetical protein